MGSKRKVREKRVILFYSDQVLIFTENSICCSIIYVSQEFPFHVKIYSVLCIKLSIMIVVKFSFLCER